VKLQELVKTWSALRGTRSRKKKTALLAELLRACTRREAELVVSYLSGQLPQGKIGIGHATLRDVTTGDVEKDGGGIPLLGLDHTFQAIADEKGPGSGARRSSRLRELLASISEPERRFVSGLVVGELRQGASEGVMCEAIAEAAGVPADRIRRAFMLCGQLPQVALSALEGGVEALDQFRVELFVPLRPMLARPEEDVQSAIEALGEALFETKLDGARVQAHKHGNDVRIYSRALNDVTRSVPEVVETVRALPASNIILDGEAIAIRSDGRPHAFQTTMRRFGRRRSVDAQRESLPLSVYFFDLLYLDGVSLIDLPLSKRRERLEALLPSELLPAGSITGDVEQAEALWASVIAQGHEGLMAKAAQSLYEAGNRGAHWLKLKPTHTLDLVIVAAEWGSGRRKGWLSNLHLAAYDPDADSYAMLGKTFKGLTDEMLEWQTRELLARETHREDYVVHVRPELVAEVAFNDVQVSSRYPSGLALRFARLKRYRPDKEPRNADQLDTVRDIYRNSTQP
jgi:DNA ligase-1